MKTWRVANKEQIAAKHKAWQAANRDKVLAYKKVWNAANPEKVSAHKKIYDAAHPNDALARLHKHRAKRLGAKIGDTAAIIIWLDSWRTEAPASCHYCKAVAPGIKMTVDHVIPMSAGGDHDLPNLVVCCLSCNSSKKDQLPEVWQAQINL